MISHADADRFLESPGVPRLRYRDEGKGPAILLVHGWLLDLSMWDALTAALVPRFRVIRWDRRGFGKSAGVPDLSVDAADGMRLLDLLGVKRTAVLGMSQGCRIALNIVEREPERTGCLILDGAPPLEGLPDRQWHNETPVFEYRALLVNQGIAALRAQLATHPLLQLHAGDAAAQARMDSMLARYAGADLMALPPVPTPGPPADVPKDRFSRLQLPVMVLNGAFDTAQRLRIGATLAQCINGAERVIVPDSRHMACWDNPATYAQCILHFLNKQTIDGP
jgi:3-oxoadipate enol-lactonase